MTTTLGSTSGLPPVYDLKLRSPNATVISQIMSRPRTSRTLVKTGRHSTRAATASRVHATSYNSSESKRATSTDVADLKRVGRGGGDGTC